MKMEKPAMCRTCLVEDVRMYVVLNKNLQELYEKLTDVPFVTEDHRPMLACFFCYAKLKQCEQFQRKCLEAEELFAQMLNEDCEPKSGLSREHLRFHGLIRTPMEHINIDDECQIESNAIKEELPTVCERQDDIFIKQERDCQNDEGEDIPLHHSKTEYILPHHCETLSEDSEEDVPLTEIKIETGEEQELLMEKPRVRETERVDVVKTLKLKTKTEKPNTAEPENELSNSKIIQCYKNCTSKPTFIDTSKCENCNMDQVANCKQKCNNLTKRTSKKLYKCDICQRILRAASDLKRHMRVHTGEKPYKCNECPRSFTHKGDLTKHTRIHTGEKPCKCHICQRGFSQSSHLKRHIIQVHSGKKPFKCEICQRSFNDEGNLKRHTRIHTLK